MKKQIRVEVTPETYKLICDTCPSGITKYKWVSDAIVESLTKYKKEQEANNGPN